MNPNTYSDSDNESEDGPYLLSILNGNAEISGGGGWFSRQVQPVQAALQAAVQVVQPQPEAVPAELTEVRIDQLQAAAEELRRQAAAAELRRQAEAAEAELRRQAAAEAEELRRQEAAAAELRRQPAAEAEVPEAEAVPVVQVVQGQPPAEPAVPEAEPHPFEDILDSYPLIVKKQYSYDRVVVNAVDFIKTLKKKWL